VTTSHHAIASENWRSVRIASLVHRGRRGGGCVAPLAKGRDRAHEIGRIEELRMPLKVVALITVKAGEESAFIAAANTCVAASRAEPGALYYDLWREPDGERRFLFNELYVDEAAVQAHMTSDHFKAFGLAARDLAAGPPTIIVTHPIDVE
jgi:quinol monooxygenase YgiN